ncbi:FHA domain-containing protein [Variovorax guangxiensis]|uniref:FHA domain-containing protein n=1 Tax=Variovorax guangxiensis TaxID=1775474 RepID=A0A502DSS3_9BURK|nr:FHA domain-containing protein [Variovorax guangxiensis]TPG24127.1 FHA domain-containing protein [Variovorax ginsengisoli]TPG28377.1 FHA domain-containing protein [Variovorax guangxiensis]
MKQSPTFNTASRATGPSGRGLRAFFPCLGQPSWARRHTTQWTGGPLNLAALDLHGAAPETEASPHQPHLIAIDAGGQTKLITLQAGRTTLGRDARSTIVLDSPLASRQHAMLMCEGDAVVLRDLGSSNGSFVNDQQVQQRALRHGDVLTLGEDCFRFLAPPLAYRAPQILDLLDSIPAELALNPR